jgi:protease-4
MDDSVPPPPPLPPSSPPVIVPPAPSAPVRRGGRGWMILALILFVLLAFSLLTNMRHFASSLMGGRVVHARAAGPRLEEILVEQNDAFDKIAVIEVNGIITSRMSDGGGFNMVEVIRAQLKRAEEDDRVKAVLLKVDSPGGEVLASDEIYHALADFQTKAAKPIVASMGNLAASGGYYISAPCQWIVANDLTITGSIGVILHSWNYRGLMNKVGLQPDTYKSGKFKDMLSGEREPGQIPPEEREMVQSLINETYEKFKSAVANGRKAAQQANKGKGRPLDPNWGEYADGRVLSGTKAYELGFVDQLGTLDDAVARARTLAGISKANLVEYRQRYELSDFLRLFGKSEGRSQVVKVDLGLDVPRLQAGQLYFLSSTFAH